MMRDASYLALAAHVSNCAKVASTPKKRRRAVPGVRALLDDAQSAALLLCCSSRNRMKVSISREECSASPSELEQR
jgi:hypothetical protein